MTVCNAVLQAALWWIAQGFGTIPIQPRGKKPTVDNWQHLRINASNAPQYFNGQSQNIGVLLGLNDKADIDLYSREAICVASYYLPTTGIIFGRASKPQSHWMYCSPGLKTKRFLDPLDGSCILEIRGLKTDGSIGLQTVVAPGIHESGELIEFAQQAEPATVAPDLLLAAGSKIAAAAVLARHWPDHGRHNAMLALAGILARAGWPIEEAKKFCRVLYGTVLTHDPKAVDRSDSEVADTYAKHGAGEAITGFPTLMEAIDYRVLSTAMAWLSIEAPDWHSLLICGKSGPKPILANACIALRSAPQWQGVLGFDEFASRAVALKPTPWDKTGLWDGADDLRTCESLHLQGICVSSKIAAEAVEVVSREHLFHPVRRYLQSLTWDHEARLEEWLIVCFGAPDNQYTRAVSKRWLISAVARVMRPGAKVDCVLVLIGKQGSLKSTGLSALMPDQSWFSDHLSDIGGKDSRLEMSGKWLIEIAEFDRIHRGDLARVKAFITCRTDNYRPPYGRRVESVLGNVCSAPR